MTGGGGDLLAAAGGPARHIPVLGRQAVDALMPHDGGLYLDATFGAGGYTRMLLSRAQCRVIGIDRDRTALAAAIDLVEAAGGRLTLAEANFSEMERVVDEVGPGPLDGIVLDLGVSSMQLDTAARGFSFRFDGPLDMRMGTDGPSAADVIAHISERDLARVLHVLGEERHARAIARAVVQDRAATPFTTTAALAGLIARVAPQRGADIHPATRAFQALRILVNDELGELVAALAAAERLLRPGGHLAVVSFHSLEDRIVKQFLNDRGRAASVSRHQPEIVPEPPTFAILTKRPVAPDEAEIAANPRARSAKLRVAARTAAAPRPTLPALLPEVPSLSAIMERA